MLNPERRFWLKVWPRGDCWEWRGRFGTTGYGAIKMYGEETWRAHRLAFYMTKGLIPVGLSIDHTCNHKWCMKPSHLVLCTHRENSLRGAGATAVNARKTHCKRGHEFTMANARRRSDRNGRECRVCRRTGKPSRKGS